MQNAQTERSKSAGLARERWAGETSRGNGLKYTPEQQAELGVGHAGMPPLSQARICLYLKREACISKQGGTTGIYARPCRGGGLFLFQDFVHGTQRKSIAKSENSGGIKYDYCNESECNQRKH